MNPSMTPCGGIPAGRRARYGEGMVLAARTRGLGTENAFKILHDIATCRARGIDVVPLNLGEPDFDTPGFIADAAVAEIRAGNTHYSDPAGIAPLREAIAGHVASSRGIPVDPEQVVVTAGAKPTIGYALQAYVEPGDEVIYPSPGFPIYESWVTYMGAKPVPLQLSEDRGFTFTAADLDRLITPATKLVILNSPSNPTGGVLSEPDLAGIAAVLGARGGAPIRVYSDEVYEHLVFDGEAHHSISSQPEMAAMTVLVGGHSKSFAMTGWRLGFAVLPTRAEARFFEQLNINLFSCVPPFIQHAGVAALTDPTSAAAVAVMVEQLQTRRDWMVAALNDIPGVSCLQPKGAFYTFPNVSAMCRHLGVLQAFEALPPQAAGHWTPATMLQMFLLYRHGVATMDRASFGRIGTAGQHYLRLSFAAGIDELRRGVDRIGQAAADITGFASFNEGEAPWRPAMAGSDASR